MDAPQFPEAIVARVARWEERRLTRARSSLASFSAVLQFGVRASCRAPQASRLAVLRVSSRLRC
eukprot:6566603-Lingulodinium_polyedra.AAC.1